MKKYFAAVGDVHGHMHAMVRMLRGWERKSGTRLSFVLQVGDFEPHRHEADLATMAAPQKYREMGDFSDFLKGWDSFPQPLYFIGGNHEPYGYLDSMPTGGTLISNCHYLGRSGIHKIEGLMVATLSGIYGDSHFNGGRPSVAAFDSHSNKDFTYFTEDELCDLVQSDSPNILLVHDWPKGIIPPKDAHLFENRRRAASVDAIGNQPVRDLMDLLEPNLVLCGHMHFPYRNTILMKSGKLVNICCLDQVSAGPGALAVFSIDEQGDIEEVQGGPSGLP